MSRLMVVLAGLVLVLTGGCAFLAGAGVMTAGIVYVQGEARKVMPMTLDNAYQATVQTLDAMDVVIMEQHKASDGWHIRARRSTDAEEVQVQVLSAGANTTEVRVRVGLSGDRPFSESLLNAISARA